MASFAKLPFIFFVAFSLHTCYKLPNPPPTKEERLDLTENFFPVRYKMKAKILFWVVAMVEALSIVIDALAPYTGNLLYLTPTSIIGAMMIMAGAYIRNECFTAMGPMFTVEVSIQKNHKLIKHGPYRIVRHPSYTGQFLATVGAFMWYFSQGSYLRETTTMAGRILGVALLPMFISSFFILGSRINKEDEALKEKFGVEWENWALDVPYRLIPLIY